MERRVPGERTDSEFSALDAQKIEFRVGLEIEEMSGPRKPEIHGGDEALSAGNHLAVVT